jgi:hypothetical protein
MEVWLGAENPAGTVYEYQVDCLFHVPPPHLSAGMRGEINIES